MFVYGNLLLCAEHMLYVVMAKREQSTLVMSEIFSGIFRVSRNFIIPLLTFIRLLLTGQTNKFRSLSDGFSLPLMVMIKDKVGEVQARENKRF